MDWRSLPLDLIEEILSRVPTKSLARLRSTSKRWNHLSKSGSFALKHSANAPKESLIIMLMDYRVYFVRISFYEIHDDDETQQGLFRMTRRLTPISVNASARRFDLKDPPFNTSQVHIRNVFNCDGLLLCTTTRDNRLVVWNPCSGETKWVKPRDSFNASDYYALGYDNKSSCKQYKILRVDRQCLPIKNEYEIYDFTSDSWRFLGVATDWFLALYRRGISAKGNTYWVATQAGRPHADFLLSFDFSTERFQSLCFPLPHPFPYRNAALSVVGDEQIFLLCTCRKVSIFGNVKLNDLQVWVANGTGSVRSWSKSLAMANYRGKTFADGMVFLVDEQNEVVMYLKGYNTLHVVGEDKYTKTPIVGDNLGGDSKFGSVLLNYVPSLAQIQQGGGRKRKAPSTCYL